MPRGAKFYRADLHIHSFGASHDVKDVGMTPAAIVQEALSEGLGVIAVADHNEISNVQGTIDAATNTGLLVVPAVELSTSQGHLLCYLPDVDSLGRFHAQLDVAERGSASSRCRTALLQCLALLESFHGFGVLAHVDGPGGFEEAEPGFSPHKTDVVAHRALLGIELKSATSTIAYAPLDSSSDRAGMGKVRIERLGLGERQYLARVMNSDAHSLTALGRNAQGDHRVTRFKMDVPSFEALRIALQDSDARVRLEEEVPRSFPIIVGVQFEGGFLDKQAIHLSPNLNCIIGGRGTGKSTSFEALRCLTREGTSSDVVDSDVWPDEITFIFQDASGLQHSLLRRRDGVVEHLTDAMLGPTSFEIDCFGQSEAARISAQLTADPLALLRHLDRFTGVSEALSQEQAACDKLLNLQSKTEDAETKVESIPLVEKALNITRQQIAALKTAKAEQVITLQRKVAEERSLRQQVQSQLDNLDKAAQRSQPLASETLRAIAEPSGLTLGVKEFESILVSLEGYEALSSKTSSDLRRQFLSVRELSLQELGSWKEKETGLLTEIEAKRKELEAQGLRLDMAYIQKLAKDEATQQQNLINLKAWQPHLDQLRKERETLLKERWAARDRVSGLRDAYARQASSVLSEELTNPKVTLKFVPDGYSPAACDLIVSTMGWRTIQVPRAQLLVEQLTVPKLLKIIATGDKRTLTEIKTSDGIRVFDSSDAGTIIERLSQKHVKWALERCVVHDLPRLIVTKRIEEGGKDRYIPRDFAKLSLGQQQSVLLALILCSSGNHPLLLDQPEDNLDGEFIFHTLVPVLRRAKERRQIVVVTHNANIAVLGDAELIVAMKSGAERGVIVGRGSIDNEKTCQEACQILEGAKEAFQRRARTYGFKLTS